MKKTFLAACAASLVVPTALLAQQAGPPPAVVTQQNLGGAGLLGSFYSASQYGITRARMGENGARIGAALGPGAPTTGYQHESFTGIGMITGRKMVGQGTSYLTFGASFNNKEEFPNITDIDTQIRSFSIGYQNFANVNTAYAAYLSYEHRDSNGAVVHTGRESITARFDVAHKFSDHWGVTGRAVYSTGDLHVDFSTPFGLISSVEKQTSIYGQAELVGNFSHDDLSAVPAGWEFNPIFGISYDSERTGNSAATRVTMNSGSVWAKGTLTKTARPGNWEPNFTLGVEHEYLQDAALFIDEDTYAIVGAGVSRMDTKGNILNIAFERRQGLKGNRINNTLIAGYTFNF